MAAPEAAIIDLHDFLTTTLARQVEAEEAIHNGDPTPHLALWSWRDPVILFGAGARGKQAGLSMTPQEVITGQSNGVMPFSRLARRLPTDTEGSSG
jgi:hypothetical protein